MRKKIVVIRDDVSGKPEFQEALVSLREDLENWQSNYNLGIDLEVRVLDLRAEDFASQYVTEVYLHCPPDMEAWFGLLMYDWDRMGCGVLWSPDRKKFVFAWTTEESFHEKSLYY